MGGMCARLSSSVPSCSRVRADHRQAEADQRRTQAQRRHFLREHARFLAAQPAAAVFLRPCRRRPAARRHHVEPLLGFRDWHRSPGGRPSTAPRARRAASRIDFGALARNHSRVSRRKLSRSAMRSSSPAIRRLREIIHHNATPTCNARAIDGRTGAALRYAVHRGDRTPIQGLSTGGSVARHAISSVRSTISVSLNSREGFAAYIAD